ncbi:hypothetical protein V6N12_061075 [Hibiscus sabdariffa]|uniref:UBP-type domain-containing protein n=1 Tax=Hibiscus sabdariffa TaxID=183260 RepID=A0ABR2DW07_9ROSI
MGGNNEWKCLVSRVKYCYGCGKATKELGCLGMKGCLIDGCYGDDRVEHGNHRDHKAVVVHGRLSVGDHRVGCWELRTVDGAESVEVC